MSIKIIATDLDGTLMAPDHLTVTERTKKALFAAHEKGVKIAIATGRTLSAIDNVTNQIPFVDYVVFSNGAVVYDRNKNENIYTNYLPKETATEITDFLEKYPAFYEAYQGGKQHAQPDKTAYFKNNGLPEKFLEEYTRLLNMHDSISDFIKNNDIEKINLFYFGGEYHEEIQDFLFAHKGIDCTSPVAGDIEMTASGVDKGEALKGLCDALDISLDDVMAFGDADNDIEMLSLAGYSFAMENASDECKKIAKYLAPSNADDGVAAMVEKYVL